MPQIDITKEKKGMFAHALAGASSGDEIVYHIGESLGGTHKGEAYGAGEAGLCHLYQRRLHGSVFAYIARKKGA